MSSTVHSKKWALRFTGDWGLDCGSIDATKLAKGFTLEAWVRAAGQDRGARLYADPCFAGRPVFFRPDRYDDLSKFRIGAKKASSLQVPLGCRAILFTGKDCQGGALMVDEDTAHLPAAWDDSAQSLTVIDLERPRQDHVVVFSGEAFLGTAQTFDTGRQLDLTKGAIGGEAIRSLVIPPGLEVTLYDSPDCRGKSICCQGEVENLGADWNGKARSLAVHRAPAASHPEVTVYDSPSFTGKAVSFPTAGRKKLAAGTNVKSIRIPEGLQATLVQPDGSVRHLNGSCTHLDQAWVGKNLDAIIVTKEARAGGGYGVTLTTTKGTTKQAWELPIGDYSDLDFLGTDGLKGFDSSGFELPPGYRVDLFAEKGGKGKATRLDSSKAKLDPAAKTAKSLTVHEDITIFGTASSGLHLQIPPPPMPTKPPGEQFGGKSLKADRWCHIAVVWDGKQQHSYLNGKLAGSETPASAPDLSGALRMGDGFCGEIGSVRLRSTARTAKELRTDRHALPAKGDPNLIAAWNLEDGKKKTPPTVPSPSELTSGHYSIIARHSGKCLEVENASLENNALVRQGIYANQSHQHFKFEAASANGHHTIIARHSNRYVCVQGAYKRNGAPIHQFDYYNVPDQQWELEPTGDGYVRFVVKHTGKAMEVLNGSRAFRAEFVQDKIRPGQAYQEFRLEKVGAPIADATPPQAPALELCSTKKTKLPKTGAFWVRASLPASPADTGFAKLLENKAEKDNEKTIEEAEAAAKARVAKAHARADEHLKEAHAAAIAKAHSAAFEHVVYVSGHQVMIRAQNGQGYPNPLATADTRNFDFSAFYDDDKKLVCFEKRGVVISIDLASGASFSRGFNAPFPTPLRPYQAGGGWKLALASTRGHLEVFDLDSSDAKVERPSHGSTIEKFEVANYGSWRAVSASRDKIVLWNLDYHPPTKMTETSTGIKRDGKVLKIGLSRQQGGWRAITHDRESEQLCYWNLDYGSSIRSFPTKGYRKLVAIEGRDSVLGNRSSYENGKWSRSCRIWDFETGNYYDFENVIDSDITSAESSRNGDRVMLSGNGSQPVIALWNRNSNTTYQPLDHYLHHAKPIWDSNQVIGRDGYKRNQGTSMGSGGNCELMVFDLMTGAKVRNVGYRTWKDFALTTDDRFAILSEPTVVIDLQTDSIVTGYPGKNAALNERETKVATLENSNLRIYPISRRMPPLTADVALDPATREVFSARRGSGANLVAQNGFVIRDLFNRTEPIHSVAIDPTGTDASKQFVYWIEGAGRVCRGRMDGAGGVEVLLERAEVGGTGLWDLAIDVERQHLFWSNGREIWRGVILADGKMAPPGVVVTHGRSPEPIAIAVEDKGGTLVWLDRQTESVWRSAGDGGGILELYDAPTPREAITIDAEAGRVYWNAHHRSLKETVSVDQPGLFCHLQDDGAGTPRQHVPSLEDCHPSGAVWGSHEISPFAFPDPKVIQLDGSPTGISLPGIGQNWGSLSFEAFVYCDDISGEQCFIELGNGEGSERMQAVFRQGELVCVHIDAGGKRTEHPLSTRLPERVWSYLRVAWYENPWGKTEKLLSTTINSSTSGTLNFDAPKSCTKCVLGGRTEKKGAKGFAGQVAMLRTWNTYINNDEADRNYQQPLKPPASSPGFGWHAPDPFSGRALVPAKLDSPVYPPGVDEVFDFDGGTGRAVFDGIKHGKDKPLIIEIWFFIKDRNTSGTILELGQGTAGPRLEVSYRGDDLVVTRFDGAGKTWSQERRDSLVDRQWVHLVIDGNYGYFYVNGRRNNDIRSLSLPASQCVLGGGTSGKGFSGQVASVRLWERPLSSGEISESFLAPQSYPSNLDDLVFDSRKHKGVPAIEPGAKMAAPRTGSESPALLGGRSVLKFDGVHDHVALGPTNIDFTKGFTFEAWLRWLSFPSDAGIIAIGDGESAIALSNYSGRCALRLEAWRPGKYTYLTTESVIPTASWLHVAATIDGDGAATIYANGLAIAQGHLDIPPQLLSDEFNYIGRKKTGNHFHGQVGTLRLWNQCLSQESVRKNALDPFAPPEGATPNYQRSLVEHTSRNPMLMTGSIDGLDPAVPLHPLESDGGLALQSATAAAHLKLVSAQHKREEADRQARAKLSAAREAAAEAKAAAWAKRSAARAEATKQLQEAKAEADRQRADALRNKRAASASARERVESARTEASRTRGDARDDAQKITDDAHAAKKRKIADANKKLADAKADKKRAEAAR